MQIFSTKKNKKKNKKTKRELASKGYASSYNVEILNSINAELQLEDTQSAVKSKLIELLPQLRRFTFVTTLALVFKKIESKDKTKYDNIYSSSKTVMIVNESDIKNVFKSIYTTIITNIQKSLGKWSGQITDSVIYHSFIIQNIILQLEAIILNWLKNQTI